MATSRSLRHLLPWPCFALAKGALAPSQASGLCRQRQSEREFPSGDLAEAAKLDGFNLVGGEVRDECRLIVLIDRDLAREAP